MGECRICKIPIDWDKDKFYHQRLVDNDKIITVMLCEDCMAELHKCPHCDMARPYCNDCV